MLLAPMDSVASSSIAVAIQPCLAFNLVWGLSTIEGDVPVMDSGWGLKHNHINV